MKKKMNLTAIIAVAMVAMSVLVLGSCNADDDYNEFDYGTLAKGMVTRSGETNSKPIESKNVAKGDTIHEQYILTLNSEAPEISKGQYVVSVDVNIYQKDSALVADMLSYNILYSACSDRVQNSLYGETNVFLFQFYGLSFVEDVYPHDRYYLCAGGSNNIGVNYTAKLENRLFFVR